MTRPVAWAVAMAFLALGSPSVYASESDISEGGGVAAGGVPLPDFDPADADLYPESAARKLLQGSVGVEFQIDGQGRAQVLGQTFSDHPDFAANAAEVLTRGHFNVPEDWVQSGGAQLRFVVEIQFIIARGETACSKKPPHVADTSVVMVCKAQPSRRRGRL